MGGRMHREYVGHVVCSLCVQPTPVPQPACETSPVSRTNKFNVDGGKPTAD